MAGQHPIQRRTRAFQSARANRPGICARCAAGGISHGHRGGRLPSRLVTHAHHYVWPLSFAEPMEPNACTVAPRDEDLFVYVGTQIVDAARASIAATLQVDPERIHVISPYVGGGFGSKLWGARRRVS